MLPVHPSCQAPGRHGHSDCLSPQVHPQTDARPPNRYNVIKAGFPDTATSTLTPQRNLPEQPTARVQGKPHPRGAMPNRPRLIGEGDCPVSKQQAGNNWVCADLQQHVRGTGNGRRRHPSSMCNDPRQAASSKVDGCSCIPQSCVPNLRASCPAGLGSLFLFVVYLSVLPWVPTTQSALSEALTTA